MRGIRRAAIIMLGATLVCADAQWLNYPTAGIPRTRDGKPDLAARTPRGRKGKPLLSGLWQTESAPRDVLARLIPDATNGAGEEPLSQYFINIFSDLRPEEEPLQPAAVELYRERAKNFARESPLSHCLPEGMPMVEMAPAPYKIVETPGLTLMLYERGTIFRQVYTVEVQLTVDDPQTYTRPFTITLKQKLLPDTDLLESVCAENEKDAPHTAGK